VFSNNIIADLSRDLTLAESLSGHVPMCTQVLLKLFRQQYAKFEAQRSFVAGTCFTESLHAFACKFPFLLQLFIYLFVGVKGSPAQG